MVQFNLDQYSSLKNLDTLMDRIMENKINSLNITKEGDDYFIEYSFDHTEMPTQDQSKLYDFLKTFKGYFISRRIDDVDFHYAHDNQSFVSNFSLRPSLSPVQDDVLYTISTLENLKSLMDAKNLSDLPLSLKTKVEGSRKYTDTTLKEAFEDMIYQLSNLKIE